MPNYSPKPSPNWTGPRSGFPYLRILVSLVENAHPEWNQAPQKDQQIAELIYHLSGKTLDPRRSGRRGPRAR